MFRPFYGKCEGKGSYEGCGNSGWITTNSRRLCQACEAARKPKKTIKPVSEKRKEKVTTNKAYYKWAIGQNIIKNKGVCRCDNCKEQIKNPLGKNHGRAVCHIVGSGNNDTLYTDPINHFVLGRGPVYGECNCGWLFDESGKKDTMNIYPEYVKRREILNNKYYTKSN